MNRIKFTPGPWIKDGTFIVGKNNITVASAHYGPLGPHRLETIQANAALVAAAPEMYETLRCIAQECNGDGHFPLMGMVLDALARARSEV